VVLGKHSSSSSRFMFMYISGGFKISPFHLPDLSSFLMSSLIVPSFPSFSFSNSFSAAITTILVRKPPISLSLNTNTSKHCVVIAVMTQGD